MIKIRVLIVEDSVSTRRMLIEELSSDPDIEVAGFAENGKVALSKISVIQPDLVTMNIEMPEMDGLTAVTEIRKLHAQLPIIMFSTLSQRGARETLDALYRGANDYVSKDSCEEDSPVAVQRVREELIPKIKALCPGMVGDHLEFSTPTPIAQDISRPSSFLPSCQKSEVVAIGVSTGGPHALEQVIPLLPEDFPLPIVIVQHMPPLFTKSLAERLSEKSHIPVFEGTQGAILRPGEAWIAPGDFHMTVRREGATVQLDLNKAEPENSCRPAVDVLFRSVASVYGSGALAVILTGMGHDGLNGCEHIHKSGGHILVQDRASSVVWGMPGAVARAGLAQQIAPLHQMADYIVQRVNLFSGSPLNLGSLSV